MCKILLDSIEKVKKFVDITSKFDEDIYITSNRYVIDAKSIMGILSLDLTKELTVVCEGQENLMKKIEEFTVA